MGGGCLQSLPDAGEMRSAQQVLVRLAEPVDLELPRPVVFDLVDFELDGDLIRMRAADDLAGCAGYPDYPCSIVCQSASGRCLRCLYQGRGSGPGWSPAVG